MATLSTRELLEKLKAELGSLEYGRHRKSVHLPWEEASFFQDSETCINHGLEGRPNPCGACMLIDFVPAGARTENIPCHHIPLDEKGTCIDGLDRGYNRSSVEEAVAGWLRGKIAELEREVESVEPAAFQVMERNK
jgi:methyl coenzyme M reductase gamma subunit